MPEGHVLDLNRIPTNDFVNFGGKASNLSLLHHYGINIPEGFAISGHYFVKMLESDGTIRDMITYLDRTDDFEEVLEIGVNLQASIARMNLPIDLIQEVTEKFTTFTNIVGCESGYAIRSSASVEDGKDFSFAGQADTYLCVKEIKDVLESIKKVWMSALSPQAIIYLKTKGVPISRIRMGVVIQEMVNASISGVLFTANVIDNNKDQMLIEATWGLGEALVGGNVVPDTYIIDRVAGVLVSKTLGSKKVTYVQGKGCTVKLNTPLERSEEFTLGDKELKKLVEYGITIEEKMSAPQDIEWSIRDGDIVILQSRPITTLQ